MKIVAIIISFNRLGMVQRCVESLRAQTRPLDAILVVDSSTQAEVRAWLDAQPDVTPLYVPDEGSAGAMHYGLQWGLTHDFDWMWLFDDDVVAAPDALAQLLNCLARRPEIEIINSLSLDETNLERPSAGAIRWRNDPHNYLSGGLLQTVTEIRARADADGLLNSVGGQLYQGTLLSRRAVSVVGMVHPVFFTRGDEVDYSLRLMRAGYPIYLCISSIVTHPPSNTVFIKVFGKTFMFGRMTSTKRYYSIRNSLWIRRVYYSRHPFWLYVWKRGAAGIVQELLVEQGKPLRARLRGCQLVVRATRDGLNLPAALHESPATRM